MRKRKKKKLISISNPKDSPRSSQASSGDTRMSRVESIIFPGANYASTFQGERGYSWRHRNGVCLMNATPMLSSSPPSFFSARNRGGGHYSLCEKTSRCDFRLSNGTRNKSITFCARFIDIFVGASMTDYTVSRERRRAGDLELELAGFESRVCVWINVFLRC